MSVTGTLSKKSNFPACITSWTQFVDLMLTKLEVNISSTLSYIISDTTPGVDDQDKLWIKTSSGYPIGRFIYKDAWIWPHEIANTDKERRIFVGSLAELKTYDGGEDAAVTDTTGPFWEEDTDLQARFPVGAGTFAAAGTVAVGGTGGADQHTLTEAEMPTHDHDVTLVTYNNFDSSNSSAAQLMAGNQQIETAGTSPNLRIEDAGSSDPHNNLPPYYGVYFIKRTSRKYRRG